MSEQKQIPVSGRTAVDLSKAYGFGDVQAMADSLPAGARVVDFGSGNSDLGMVIAELRPDIDWTNVDLMPAGVRRLGKMAVDSNLPEEQSAVPTSIGPANFHELQASVLDNEAIRKAIPEASLDAAFSSWLIPHVYSDSPQDGEQAVHTMARSLKPNGTLFVLPHGNPAHTAKDYAADPAGTVDRVIGTLKNLKQSTY